MAEKRQYRLKIDGFTPETMPMKMLLDCLNDLAVLFGVNGVHLINIESSSVAPVLQLDWNEEPKALDRVEKAKRGEGAAEAVNALKSMNARLHDNNASAQLVGPASSNVVEFPGAKAPVVKPVEWPSINQASTLYGIPIAIGGKNDPVPVHLQDGNVDLNLLTSREIAKQIAQYLFSTVLRVVGRGRWRKEPNGGPWTLERFMIDEFEPVKIANFDDALAQLRSIDAEWKRREDPLAELHEMRHGE